jgi:hypothetical protein
LKLGPKSGFLAPHFFNYAKNLNHKNFLEKLDLRDSAFEAKPAIHLILQDFPQINLLIFQKSPNKKIITLHK